MEQRVGESAIDGAPALIVADKTSGADVEHHALAERPGDRAEQRLGVEELPVERGQMQQVEVPTLAHEVDGGGGEAERIGSDLDRLAGRRRRIGHLHDVHAAQPEIVDQAPVGRLVAAACGAPRPGDRPAIGDAQRVRTRLVQHRAGLPSRGDRILALLSKRRAMSEAISAVAHNSPQLARAAFTMPPGSVRPGLDSASKEVRLGGRV